MLKKKIAIIGSGISGMSAAYFLQQAGHEITLFEKNDYIGGHSRTVSAQVAGKDIPVDTGFIVYNEQNYPLLTKLFAHLQVATHASDMSFGISINDGWLEYGTKALINIIGQKINLVRPDFWRMNRDILFFNKNAEQYLQSDLTLGELLDEMQLGEWFRKYYLLPMGGSIWSTPTSEMLNFPAKTFIQFFKNHGLLTVNQQPKWRTVIGGSKNYVKKLTANFAQQIRLNTPITSVTRIAKAVEVKPEGQPVELFDEVIFASHADQTLHMFENPTEEETKLLSAFKFYPNQMYLHKDLSLMPRNKKCWSSWVYLSKERDDQNPAVSLSYWMNNLQPLETEQPIIVTLNPAKEIAEEDIFDHYEFHHPAFSKEAIAAQQQIDEIQGKDRIWFCGAYLRYGFHEDGILSAAKIMAKMQIDLPWQ